MRTRWPRACGVALAVGIAILAWTTTAIAIDDSPLDSSIEAAWKAATTTGIRLFDAGRRRDAEASFASAVALAEQMRVRDWHLVVSLQNLGDTVRSDGRGGEAERWYRRAVEIAERIVGSPANVALDALKTLATFYHGERRYDEAERVYARALDVTATSPASDTSRAGYLNVLAEVASLQGRFEVAESRAREALRLLERIGDPVSTAAVLEELAALLHAIGRATEAGEMVARSRNSLQRVATAEATLQYALEVRMAALGLEHPGLSTMLRALARVAEVQERYADAAALHERAIKVLLELRGRAQLLQAAALDDYARVLRSLRREKDARVATAQAAAIRAAIEGAER